MNLKIRKVLSVLSILIILITVTIGTASAITTAESKQDSRLSALESSVSKILTRLSTVESKVTSILTRLTAVEAKLASGAGSSGGSSYSAVYSKFVEIPASSFSGKALPLSMDLPVDAYVTVTATGYAHQVGDFFNPETVRLSLTSDQMSPNDWDYPTTGAFVINEVFHLTKGVHTVYLTGYTDNGVQFDLSSVHMTAVANQNGNISP